jgi:hypothetical protein
VVFDIPRVPYYRRRWVVEGWFIVLTLGLALGGLTWAGQTFLGSLIAWTLASPGWVVFGVACVLLVIEMVRDDARSGGRVRLGPDAVEVEPGAKPLARIDRHRFARLEEDRYGLWVFPIVAAKTEARTAQQPILRIPKRTEGYRRIRKRLRRWRGLPLGYERFRVIERVMSFPTAVSVLGLGACLYFGSSPVGAWVELALFGFLIYVILNDPESKAPARLPCKRRIDKPPEPAEAG